MTQRATLQVLLFQYVDIMPTIQEEDEEYQNNEEEEEKVTILQQMEMITEKAVEMKEF